jgi:hypothetical protein
LVPIRLSKEEVKIISAYLWVESEHYPNGYRPQVEAELQHLVGELIQNLKETGGWFGSITNGREV